MTLCWDEIARLHTFESRRTDLRPYEIGRFAAKQRSRRRASGRGNKPGANEGGGVGCRGGGGCGDFGLGPSIKTARFQTANIQRVAWGRQRSRRMDDGPVADVNAASGSGRAHDLRECVQLNMEGTAARACRLSCRHAALRVAVGLWRPSIVKRAGADLGQGCDDPRISFGKSVFRCSGGGTVVKRFRAEQQSAVPARRAAGGRWRSG